MVWNQETCSHILLSITNSKMKYIEELLFYNYLLIFRCTRQIDFSDKLHCFIKHDSCVNYVTLHWIGNLLTVKYLNYQFGEIWMDKWLFQRIQGTRKKIQIWDSYLFSLFWLFLLGLSNNSCLINSFCIYFKFKLIQFNSFFCHWKAKYLSLK